MLFSSLTRSLAKENEMFVFIWYKFLKHSINFNWSRDVCAWNDCIQMQTSSRDLHLISDAREDFMTWHNSLCQGFKIIKLWFLKKLIKFKSKFKCPNLNSTCSCKNALQNHSQKIIRIYTFSLSLYAFKIGVCVCFSCVYISFIRNSFE